MIFHKLSITSMIYTLILIKDSFCLSVSAIAREICHTLRSSSLVLDRRRHPMYTRLRFMTFLLDFSLLYNWKEKIAYFPDFQSLFAILSHLQKQSKLNFLAQYTKFCLPFHKAIFYSLFFCWKWGLCVLSIYFYLVP